MSGFADLRAKFENKNDTPPPSRGRSPAGQENVNAGSGRRIRTSFISVERSGHKSPSMFPQESMGSNEDQTSVREGANGPNAEINGEEMEVATTNGATAASGKQEEQEQQLNAPSGPTTAEKTVNGTPEQDEATTVDATNPDKPTTSGKDDAPAMSPSDPKDETAVLGGAGLAPKGESLGALLKGSDFEPVNYDSSKISSLKKSPKKAPAHSNQSTPVKKNRDTPKSTPAKIASTPKVNGSPRGKPVSARPSTASKPQVSPAIKTTKTSTPVVTDSNSPAGEASPVSPTASKTPSKEPTETIKSPKHKEQLRDEPTAAEKDHKKPITQKPSPQSTSTKPPPSSGPATTKPSNSAATSGPRRSGPHSPNTVKPKPRSPTRPVRLPGGATAATAASSAKTGSTAPPRPESRNAITHSIKASTLNKLAAPKGPPKPTAPHLRSKAPRSSLPASTAEPRPKFKPRTSTASAKAPGNDFLSRMMRPTQSSASKANEKVEQKTPPKKRISARPKKISDVNGEEADNKPAETEPNTKQQDQKQEDQAADQDEPAARQEEHIPELTEEIAEPGIDSGLKVDSPVVAQ
ncbi:MAG: hypothetical protein Q9182_005472 [Xanthomendoza sp. 2 TL-2023]